MDWSTFLKEKRGLVIAPAGHGKTHAIAECVLQCGGEGKQLILTHTHAGISSLKAKLKIMGVPSSLYSIHTISGFAQTLVQAFIDKTEIPNQDDNNYFEIIHEKATELLRCPSLKTIIRLSYNHLFVDEYQDCTKTQHNLIMLLANCISVHIFGDELQGIFQFRNSVPINFNNDLCGFKAFNLLETPWRWKKDGNCVELGEWILRTRNELLIPHCKQITIETDKAAHVWVIKKALDKQVDYKLISDVIDRLHSDSILVVTPIFNNHKGLIKDRAITRKRFDFANQFILLEAIDDKQYYKASHKIDSFLCSINDKTQNINNWYTTLIELSLNKTDLGEWIDFKKNKIKKRTGENRQKREKLSQLFTLLESIPTYNNYLVILNFLIKECHIKYQRPLILKSIITCLRIIQPDKNLYQQMTENRNHLRRGGNMIRGKCFGTTLLTKGLEFDNVIILHADKFTDKKNFYVAISRACKNLILFMENNKINFQD